MIFCKALNKEFASKELMLTALLKNEKLIIDAKKSAVKFTDGFRLNLFTEKSAAAKGVDFVKEGFVYPVINTTNYLDSHEDCHIPGIWNKSIKEQADKVYYLINHNMNIGSVVAFPSEVKPFVKELDWSELGFQRDGKTEALIFEVKLSDDSNADAVKMINAKRPVQNSVRMQYVKLFLCIDSNEKDYKEQKANWDTYIKHVSNKEVAMENGYFFAVTEAKIHKEGSMVLAGSNDLTPVLHFQPSYDTDNEPPKGTSTPMDSAKVKSIINSLSNF